MCTDVTTDKGILRTVRQLMDYGLTVEESDYKYDDSDATTIDDCLCGTDVQSILERNGVKWKSDPFGYEILED